jgi:transposase
VNRHDAGSAGERSFCEQLDYNLLWRWFLDMDAVEESFDHNTFSANREWPMEHDVATSHSSADRSEVSHSS